MRTSFVISSDAGTYVSPPYNVTNLDTFSINVVTFEFYDNVELTEVSSNPAGALVLTRKYSANSAWQDSSSVTVTASTASVKLTNGITEELRVVIADSLTGTNYINVILDVQKST